MYNENTFCFSFLFFIIVILEKRSIIACKIVYSTILIKSYG
jgi:hypothetical protein